MTLTFMYLSHGSEHSKGLASNGKYNCMAAVGQCERMPVMTTYGSSACYREVVDVCWICVVVVLTVLLNMSITRNTDNS